LEDDNWWLLILALSRYDREEAADREVEMTEEDIEHARQIMVGGHRPRIFGVDLEKAMAPLPGVDPAAVANNEYPEEVKNLIKYVMDKGLRSEGIFRRSPNAAALERLREQMDTRTNNKQCLLPRLILSHHRCKY
jgi:hypothetical protein